MAPMWNLQDSTLDSRDSLATPPPRPPREKNVNSFLQTPATPAYHYICLEDSQQHTNLCWCFRYSSQIYNKCAPRHAIHPWWWLDRWWPYGLQRCVVQRVLETWIRGCINGLPSASWNTIGEWPARRHSRYGRLAPTGVATGDQEARL